VEKKTKTVLIAISTLGLSYLAHKQKEKRLLIAEKENQNHNNAIFNKMRNGMIEMSRRNAEDSAKMNDKIIESAMTQKLMLQILNSESSQKNSQSTLGISNLKLDLKKPNEEEDEIPMIGDEEDEDFNDDENSEIFDSSPGSRKLNI